MLDNTSDSGAANTRRPHTSNITVANGSKAVGGTGNTILTLIDKKTVLSALANFACSMPTEKRRQLIRVKVNYGNGAERKRLSRLVTDVFHDMLDALETSQK